MNVERSVLVGFFGNYLINTVVAAIVALVPASAAGAGIFTQQYIAFAVLSAVVVVVLAWWYMRKAPRSLMSGVMFGVIGFVVAIATAFVTGVAGVFAKTGSLTAVMDVLPNFVPFIMNWTTLILLAYWIIPAALLGWFLKPKATTMSASSGTM